jgi:hypothetical protein
MKPNRLSKIILAAELPTRRVGGGHAVSFIILKDYGVFATQRGLLPQNIKAPAPPGKKIIRGNRLSVSASITPLS